MIEITVNSKVSAALKKAFPSPSNSATRALSKYVTQLERMLFDALSRGQTPLELKLNLVSISLHELANKGGQIGKDKIRVHKWLQDNGLALVEIVEIGSNLSGTVSKVKFTDLVKLTMPQLAQPANTTLIDDVAIANDLLASTTQASADLFEHLYPDFDQCVANQTLEQVFDAVDVDMTSIENYIKWLRDDAKLISASKRTHYLFQAQIILSVAKDKGGKYYQRKRPSDFGRTYYAGTSVQNVNKELRRAMLGNCWEYDIRSSVIAWKMGYAQACFDATSPTSNFRSAFRWTLSYLENKTGFMNAVQYVVFGNTSELAKDLQAKILKQAFTALSFGARKTAKGWMDSNGEWVNPAIVDIIQIEDERERFLADVSVCGFITEQSMLDTFLFDVFKQSRPDLLKLPYLQTQGGNPSKAKAIAFMYQHEETTVMDIVRNAVVENGKTMLANIHDAIIVKERLVADLKQEIEMRMQEQTANPYWHLGVKELRRFESDNKEAKLEELAHKQRMQRLEAAAVGHKSPFISSSSNP
ncbi:hypothetical protein [Flavobacterium sp.]|jgi:hypothetical protein|uniref:hypothetical protein n=1 Tax=Flavobacterium sp. TaxID=239 RepID=UPI0037C1ADE2